MGRMTKLMLALAVALVACDTTPGADSLDTRTFELRHIEPSDAETVIAPYVYGDREGAPGMVSYNRNTRTVSVRETPDNLAKIERVLAEYDRPAPTIALRLQVIRANGAAAVDPAISDVEEQLRELFRYDGYDLVGESFIEAREGAGFRQTVVENNSNFWRIEGFVRQVRADTDPPVVALGIDVERLLATDVTIADGQAAVLGTPVGDGEAIIFVVRADIRE